jgi:hypothetical protein
MTLLRRSNVVHESGGVDVLPERGSRGCDVGRAALLWCRRLSSHRGNSARPQKSYAHRHLFAVLSKPNFVGRSIDCPDQVRNESDPLCGRPRVAGAIELRDPRDAGLSCRQRRPEHYNKFEGDFFLFSPSHAQHSVEGDGDSFSSSWRTEIRCPHAR